jgi:two-component system cell cycle sensor histidine kinase/response regulator CckA
MDLTMPKLSREETLRQLRALRPGVPVILSSGDSQMEATRKFVGKGLASFLQKPFTLQQLVRAVEAALEPRGKQDGSNSSK